MSYLLLCLVFLAVAGITAVVALLRSRARRDGRLPVVALGIAGLALLGLTAVFDTLMITVGLFDYSDAHISGLRVALAPVEDFAYPLAAVILLPALWSLLGGRVDR